MDTKLKTKPDNNWTEFVGKIINTSGVFVYLQISKE